MPQTRLATFPELIQTLGKVAKEESFRELGRIHQTIEASARIAAERAPQEAVRLVRESVEAAAEALEKNPKGLSESEQKSLPILGRALALVTHDPRNAREAAEALGQIETLISKMPVLSGLVNEALDVLEEKGVLGQASLHGIVAALVAAGAAGALQAKTFLDGGEIRLAVGGQELHVDRLGNYGASLTVHNPKWAKQAIEIVARGRAGKGGLTAETLLVRAPIALADTDVRKATLTPGVGHVTSAGGEGRTRAELGLDASLAEGKTRASLSPSVTVETGPGGVRATEAALRGTLSRPLGTRSSVSVAPTLAVRQDVETGLEGEARVDATLRFAGAPQTEPDPYAARFAGAPRYEPDPQEEVQDGVLALGLAIGGLFRGLWGR